MAERISDTKQLHPLIVRRLTDGLANALSKGLHPAIFETFRTFERQDQLYAIGRTKPGTVLTHAPAGYSWHNYGLAVDLAFDSNPQTPKVDWTWSGDWQELGKIMMAQGFEWYGLPGARFREAPHFQMTGGLDLVTAKTLYERSGLPAVWKAFDAWLGTSTSHGVK